MDSKELQRLFLDFFHSHDHPIIPSSSVVPYNDNTLLFTNSGMVQFKKLFSMTPSSLPYTSATSSQHCIRAGGKHNDLDDVGKDSYHHTFFFMLGNWSFGNYFKEQAISYAYDFLTTVLNLDKKRIYVSYYKTETECDNETLEIWKRYVTSNRILPFDEKDNFWEMGDTGPCGPCTEIHYDCRKVDEDASHLVNMDHPDVIEIWNIVFIQYFRNQDRSFSTLPMKCIDTGMGMERVLRIVNKLDSNYLTDSFVKIMCEIEKCVLKENQGKNEKNEDNTNEYKNDERTVNKTEDMTMLKNSDEKTANNNGLMTSENKTGLILYRDVYDTKDPDFRQAMAMRVIADHSRTIAVCLKDGVTFSSDGRGYVLRRIMRRAIKYCNELRLTNKMSKFVRIAAESIGIEIDNEKIEMVENEEKLFLRTLENGKKILLKHKGTLSGKDAFMLYDTYGFPFDLTEIYCAENNVKVDKEGFEKIKNEMREKSKKKEKGDEKLSFDVIDFLRKYEVTDDKYKYSCDSMDANLLCVIRDNKIIYDKLDNVHKSDEICTNDTLYLLFDKTCFYSECGGQVGDTGVIEYKESAFELLDTQKYNNYVLHTCKTNKFTIDNDAFVCKLKVDIERRESIKKNHTATHLLNHALRCKFENIEQKGSLVDDKKLRFDFTKSKGLTIDEIKEIEKYINQLIENGIPVIAKEESFANIGDNVILLKEEKYPENVRVINIKDTSSELCGGTHVNNTSEITKFRIVSEGSISNNVRRIVACTGIEALRIENNLKCKNALDLEIPLIEKLSMLELQKEKEKEQQSMRKQILNDNIRRLKEEYKNGNNTRIKCDNVGFIFECDSKGCDSKMVVKDLNSIGSIFDKEKITGVLYAITEGMVNFAIRGENALERGKMFCEQLIDGVVNGKDKCANGKGKLK